MWAITLSGNKPSCKRRLHAVQVRFAGRHHRLGLRLDQIIHDREIVRRQVPDDIHVVLEQPEVHASGVVVVQLPSVPSSISWRIFLHRSGKQERVVDHDLQISFAPPVRSILRACAAFAVNGFSTNTCLPFSKRALGQFVMRPHWRHNRDYVDRAGLQNVARIRCRSDCWDVPASPCEACPGFCHRSWNTDDRSGRLKLRTIFGPQYPYPITPMLSIESPESRLGRERLQIDW